MPVFCRVHQTVDECDPTEVGQRTEQMTEAELLERFPDRIVMDQTATEDTERGHLGPQPLWPRS